MAETMFTVFLSGTRKDLKPFFIAAKAAIDALPGYHAVSMDDADPEDIPSDRWSRREASKPDLLIGLIGTYYGTKPAGSLLSMTEQEYDAAKKLDIHRLMFLTTHGAPVEQNPDDEERINTFRRKIDADVVRREVTSPDDFAAYAVAAIRNWERITLRGATIDAEGFYRQWLTPGRLYGHQEPLVGQNDVLGKLQEFAASDARILVLHAPWGYGKSRVLLEWTRRSSATVRFIQADAQLRRQALGITAIDPCILVLEDAHRTPEESLRSLLQLLSRCTAAVKLILTSRTRQLPGINRLLTEFAFGASAILHHNLPKLTLDEQRRIIEHILGRGREEAASVLARRTHGNVLAAVTAARLFRDNVISITGIERSDDFQHEVLRRFRAAVMELVPESFAEHEELLRLIAIAGPVRPGDERSMDRLAAFLRWPLERVHQCIAELEEAGLLIRYGRLVRIAVDAVSESVLLEACTTRHGESTGYAERVLRELLDTFGENILRNLAVADWQAEATGRGHRFLPPIWRPLTAEFHDLDWSQRLDVLRHLEAVAPFQPAEVLAFVAAAIEAGVGSHQVVRFGNVQTQLQRRGRKVVALLRHLYHRLRHSVMSPKGSVVRRRRPFPLSRGAAIIDVQVQDGLATLLRAGPLGRPELLARTCDLLWRLAEHDSRQANSHPRSAERGLLEAGEYGVRKPVVLSRAFLRWLNFRLTGPAAISGERAARYLQALLKKEVDHLWSDERAIHFVPAGVNFAAVADLRHEALDTLESLGCHPNMAVAASAIRVLGDAPLCQHG